MMQTRAERDLGRVQSLRLVLYRILFTRDVTDFAGLAQTQASLIRADHDDETLERIAAALTWATTRPNFDYKSLLPHMPHSSARLYDYLCKLARAMGVA
ncbi:hypothetical protein [Massilia pseudoviolaceinigra]|uniref:hypothetical protein n=1 Tax=Massilia pseudoviolaceinigra TaxID=3057165 RepID=UPI00279655FF|nr:hypothetical protein [Massilia sp. CCM 9206]MDQ1923567.1 hypothetical protein [Massilia sp. CCM 9206]